MAKPKKKTIKELLTQLSPEAQQLVSQVIRIEKEKLYMGKPHGVIDEIQTAVKEIVRK